MAAPQRGADVRGDRAARPADRRAVRRRRRSASPAASRRCGPTCRVLVAKLAALRTDAGPIDLAMTTNGATLRLARRRPARGRAAAGQHQPRHARPRPVRRDDPARRARPRARRHRRRQGGRVRPGQGQRRRRARRQRRRDRRPRRVRPRARRRGALHRVHAARRRRALGRRDRSSARTRSSPRIDAVFPLEPMPARGAAPADRWRYLDGGGTVGVIPTRHQAVLRRLRPGPAHRRRPVPHLPVRHRRVRPAARRCAPARPTTSCAAAIERAVGTKWAGHQINQVDFVRPSRSMSQIGG